MNGAIVLKWKVKYHDPVLSRYYDRLEQRKNLTPKNAATALIMLIEIEH